ncbi:MAG: threonine aldolase, partial [Salinimicrobium sp.]
RISNMGQGKLRIVTHLDYSEEDHQRFLEVVKNIKL